MGGIGGESEPRMITPALLQASTFSSDANGTATAEQNDLTCSSVPEPRARIPSVHVRRAAHHASKNTVSFGP